MQKLHPRGHWWPGVDQESREIALAVSLVSTPWISTQLEDWPSGSHFKVGKPASWRDKLGHGFPVSKLSPKPWGHSHARSWGACSGSSLFAVVWWVSMCANPTCFQSLCFRGLFFRWKSYSLATSYGVPTLCSSGGSLTTGSPSLELPSTRSVDCGLHWKVCFSLLLLLWCRYCLICPCVWVPQLFSRSFLGNYSMSSCRYPVSGCRGGGWRGEPRGLIFQCLGSEPHWVILYF